MQWKRRSGYWQLESASAFDRDYSLESKWFMVRVPFQTIYKHKLSCGEPQRLALLVQRAGRERGWSKPVLEPFQIYWDENSTEDVMVRCYHKDIDVSWQKTFPYTELPAYSDEG